MNGYKLTKVKFNKNFITRWVRPDGWLRVKNGIDDILQSCEIKEVKNVK